MPKWTGFRSRGILPPPHGQLRHVGIYRIYDSKHLQNNNDIGSRDPWIYPGWMIIGLW